MSVTTRWEVEDALETANMDPTGRHIMLRLLTKSVAASAEIPLQHAPTFDDLAAWTGYSRSAVAEWMKALSASGWARRSSTVPNVKSGYVLGVGDATVELPKRPSRARKAKVGSPLSGPVVNEESPLVEQRKPPADAQVVRSADQAHPAGSPLSGPEVVRSADQSSPLSGPETDASPISSSLTFTNPDPAGTDQPIPSQRSASRWGKVDRKQSPTPTVTNKTRAPRQSTLFAETSVRLPEATQIVLDGLKTDGYPNATPDDARAVHAAVCKRYAGRVNANYLRAMASNRSFGPFLQDIKAARAEQVEAQIRKLQSTHPDCEHGTAAGNAKHPTTGDLLCPWCRTGNQRPAEVDRDRTHPAVAAAVTLYRQHTDRHLTVIELMRITQQASALHRRGCTAEQLADYARNAAESRTGLLEAAAVK